MHIVFHLYEKQMEDHCCGQDLMMKQLVLDLRLEGFGAKSRHD